MRNATPGTADDDVDVNVRQIVEAVAHAQPNACDLIHEAARKQPEVPAVVDMKSGARHTFAALSTTIAKVACRLKNAGVRPKDRVAVFVGGSRRRRRRRGLTRCERCRLRLALCSPLCCAISLHAMEGHNRLGVAV